MGLLFSLQASAQDHHFSQFNAAPVNLNPALTGAINGHTRVVSNYRNQWAQNLQSDAYNTYTVSGDHRVNLKTDDYLGLGLSFYGDVMGAARFGTIQLAASISYAKTLSKSGSTSHSIIGGLQLGISQRKIDRSSLRWSSQVELYGPIGSVDNTDFLFNDINGGVVWVSNFGERKSFYAGISAYHINRPNVSFQNNSVQRMSMRTSLHAGLELPLSSRLSVLPSMMYLRQGVHAQLNIGTKLGVSNSSNSFISNVQGGIFYRAGQDVMGNIHSDAIITILSLQLKGIQVGFSYDFTISKLKVNTLGALEFSVGYVFGKTNKVVSPYAVPQF